MPFDKSPSNLIFSEDSSKLTASLEPNLIRNPKIMDQKSSKITDYSASNTIG